MFLLLGSVAEKRRRTERDPEQVHRRRRLRSLELFRPDDLVTDRESLPAVLRGPLHTHVARIEETAVPGSEIPPALL
jgi:hypothetical protein